MKSAIPGLIDAVEDDSSVWNVAAGAISALSREGAPRMFFTSISNLCHWLEDFRKDLVPAIQKFIQQLNEWDKDEERTVDLLEAMSTLAEYSKHLPYHIHCLY